MRACPQCAKAQSPAWHNTEVEEFRGQSLGACTFHNFMTMAANWRSRTKGTERCPFTFKEYVGASAGQGIKFRSRPRT